MTHRRSLLAWILVPIGLPLAVIAGTWLYPSIKRPVLQPDPKAVPSVTHTSQPSQLSHAVDRARRIIRACLAEQNLPGLSVAVGVGSDIVWAETLGWSDIETRTPLTPDTEFWIGTASPIFTSAAVGLLLEKGRLKLDDEIQTYVPQFPKKQNPITLRHLMSNIGGVGTDGETEGPVFLHRCEHPVEAVPYFAGDSLLFAPGTQYRSSKYGWILVSAAVEAAAEQPFLTFMREQIFQPLRMDHTGAESATEENPDRVGEPDEDAPPISFVRDVILAPLIGSRRATSPTGKIPDRATLYSPGFGPNPVFRSGLYVMRQGNLSCYSGSLAFFSTPSDLVRFGLAMKLGTLLQPATGQLLQTSQRLASGRETGHGLGWDLETVTLSGQPAHAVGHRGVLLGRQIVSFMMFREAGIVVAVMSNISSADTSALALKVAEAFAEPAHQ